MISGTGKTKREMIRSVINGHNLHKACRQVLSNKGSAGIDGIPVQELSGYLNIPRDVLLFAIGTSEKDEQTRKGQRAAFERKGSRSFRQF